MAQPEGGELLRELEREEQTRLPEAPELPVAPQPPTDKQGPQVPVAQFVFAGNTLLTEPELQEVVAPWLNKELTIAELQYIADAVAERYRQSGYLVRAYLPQQDVNEGKIRIVIIEARLGEVRVDDGGVETLRASGDFAKSFINERQRPGDTLALHDLERSILLLTGAPGISAKTLLVASETAGHTDVVVSVSDDPLVAGSVTADNFGSRSTGSERLSADFALNNLSGRGDQLQVDGQASDGSVYGRARYSAFLGHDGLRAGFSASHYQYELGGGFEALQAEGDATTFAADARYPLVRQQLRNLNLIARLEHRSYENRQLGEITSDKTVMALTLGGSGDLTDAWGGGGVSFYSAALVAGEVDLSGNAFNLRNDELTAGSHGGYHKLTWSLGRLQKLTDTTTLWASARGQFAGGNLDSSEGFSIGGPAAVRAYPSLEGSGDSGWLATLELRRRLHASITGMAFYDYGRVRQHAEPWTGWNAGNSDQPLGVALQGAGLGVVWAAPGRTNVSLIAARRLGDNDLAHPVTGKDSDGTRTLNRVWLSASHYF